MKNIKLISFVGVDIKTDLSELTKLNRPDTEIECSILYSESQKNKRYPNYDFCEYFLTDGAEVGLANHIKQSIHLCGQSAIDKYLSKEKSIMKLCDLAYRIQLNFAIKNYPDTKELMDKINNMMQNHGHTIILQQNKSKKQFIDEFIKTMPGKLNLLHDGSGGFGREISITEEPSKGYFTGYAGGLKPENVKRIVEMIEANNPNNIPYYIDMESGVRTDNVFSISKCMEILNNLSY